MRPGGNFRSAIPLRIDDRMIMGTGLPSAAGAARLSWENDAMLYWAAVFFIIALIAGLLGFTGISVAAAEIARLVFFIFLVLFIVSLVASMVTRGPSSPP
jgi:uncharacterized membrane protein YtjA (UPF0391 family)